MNIKTILCPTDFSSASKEALVLATSLARDYAAKLLVCHVYQPPEPTAAMVSHSGVPIDRSRDEQLRELTEVRPPDPAVEHEHHMLDGNPGEAIVELAKSRSVDFIVMSTHGRTGMSRLLMGSVAESVLRQGPCPVVVVRAGVPCNQEGKGEGQEPVDRGVIWPNKTMHESRGERPVDEDEQDLQNYLG
ncbi:MAG: universal stress protein [Planctomycetota bacterium]|nr:MAG: universal stress protein [Planctomycetota bacterium]REK39836.1 MAG: universal stress protein [Planctomycetota bacterium]